MPQPTTDAPESDVAPQTTLGIPRESGPEETRVSVVPDTVAKLTKLGFHVVVEPGAGARAGFDDELYQNVGATVATSDSYRDGADGVWKCDVVAKIQAPSESEVGKMREGSTLLCMLNPAGNRGLVEKLAEAKVDALALDRIPRISRAQKMDVLSSMANIAGYRAVVEAAVVYEGFFGAAVTAAGTLPPAKVLIIGAGVAGLQAIAAARSLGAEVRAFDVRPDTKEQCESLGAKFLMLEFDESGEGEGGYAKTMSKEFIDAEMALFREQAKEVDIVVTTALIPGKKAPILWTRDMVESMKRGSVVVDMAAASGGNCEATQPGREELVSGVHVLGFTDLASRMGRTASRFFSGNIVNLLEDMVGESGYRVDLEDEVVRGALQTHEGSVLPPPARKPAPKTDPTPRHESQPKPVAKKKASKSNATVVGGLLALSVFAVVGRFAPDSFVPHFTVFVLACFIGWQVVWSVSAALHTPLMSVTNAISGIILVGGMLQAGSGESNLATLLGAVALLFASINVAGGFLVTQRMLKMFVRGDG